MGGVKTRAFTTSTFGARRRINKGIKRKVVQHGQWLAAMAAEKKMAAPFRYSDYVGTPNRLPVLIRSRSDKALWKKYKGHVADPNVAFLEVIGPDKHGLAIRSAIYQLSHNVTLLAQYAKTTVDTGFLLGFRRDSWGHRLLAKRIRGLAGPIGNVLIARPLERPEAQLIFDRSAGS